jgi:hypothetical protein
MLSKLDFFQTIHQSRTVFRHKKWQGKVGSSLYLALLLVDAQRVNVELRKQVIKVVTP